MFGVVANSNLNESAAKWTEMVSKLDEKVIRAIRIIGEDLYSAVSSFDEMGYIHFDIKDSNIFLNGKSSESLAQDIIRGDAWITLGDFNLVQTNDGKISFQGIPKHVNKNYFKTSGTPLSGDLYGVSRDLYGASRTLRELLEGTSFPKYATIEDLKNMAIKNQKWELYRDLLAISWMIKHVGRKWPKMHQHALKAYLIPCWNVLTSCVFIF